MRPEPIWRSIPTRESLKHDPAIIQAQRDLEVAFTEAGDRVTPTWLAARNAVKTLRYWRAPVSSVVAALIVPLLESRVVPVADLERGYGNATVELAKNFVTWRKMIDSPEIGNATFSMTEAALDLRFLYREAYRELPDLNFVLLLLAFQQAYFELVPTLSTRQASHMERVLVPLTQMLGMWSLRRAFLEKSLSHICSAYRPMKELLGPPEWYTKAGFAKVLRIDQNPKTKKEWRQEKAKLIDKARAFDSIVKDLKALCVEMKFDPPPRIQPIVQYPGIMATRIKAGESEQDLTSRLSVRILCHREEQCYLLLGLVHRLGKMIAAKYAERISEFAATRFGDYIALPLPNGYRALHVAIMYALKTDPEKEVLTEFRILTPSMYRLNELGVTAWRRRERHYRNASARWNLVAKGQPDNRGLRLEQKTQALVADFDLDTAPEIKGSLYVFSPHGEVKVLPAGSTALDFAYYIHSELANHTSKIEINGGEVPFNCPLRNADLIRVHHDPNVVGPDTSWLGWITTERARGSLRRGLTRRSSPIHRGRVILQDALVKSLQHYRRHKNYTLTITESLLNAFLWRTARARGDASLDVIYDEIQAGTLSPDRLVRGLISDELADAVVTEDTETRPSAKRILFCNRCYPAPGDPIEGIEHKGNITVHCRGGCSATEGARVRVPLAWLETSDLAHLGVTRFELTGSDRQELLKDLLQLIYDEPRAYLLNVNADVHFDGNADIALMVKADSWRSLMFLQAKLSQVRGVKHVQALPLGASQRYAIDIPSVAERGPAYTLLEVHDHRFMDREEIVNELISWLSVKPPAEWFLIHGQERVGKTSLARYVQYQVIPQRHRDILPVFLNLLILARPIDADNVATHIVDAVVSAVKREWKDSEKFDVSPRQQYEGAFAWMRRALEEVREHLKNRRLLIILDEFTALCSHEEHGHMDPSVFDNLRSAMTDLRNINWLLIAQDNRFHDQELWGNAAQILKRARPLRLMPLNESWAERLLDEPMKRSGIVYESADLVKELATRTGGSPYFINWIGQVLVRSVNAMENPLARNSGLKKVITRQMVDDAIEEFMRYGTVHFQHLFDQVRGIKRVLLLLIVALNKTRVEMSQLYAAAQDNIGPVSPAGLKRGLESLERQGIITIHRDGECVSVTFDLFHEWLQDVSLDDAILALKSRKQTRVASASEEVDE